jgi:D-glycero-alpha-D-manno-heptose 1-phosphate guanylyltransferase
MIPCRGRPFLEWVIRYFRIQGVSRFVISLGHQAEVAIEYLSRRPPGNVSVASVRETVPLGTGGGVRLAWEAVPEADVAVTNGDSLVLADLAPAWELFANPEVDAIVLGIHQEDASRYGTLRTNPAGRLVALEEKRPGAGLVNAGLYLLKARLRSKLPLIVPLSMETNVIPGWLADGVAIHVCPVRAPFIDIGTPESLDAAETFLAAHFPEEIAP